MPSLSGASGAPPGHLQRCDPRVRRRPATAGDERALSRRAPTPYRRASPAPRRTSGRGRACAAVGGPGPRAGRQVGRGRSATGTAPGQARRGQRGRGRRSAPERSRPQSSIAVACPSCPGRIDDRPDERGVAARRSASSKSARGSAAASAPGHRAGPGLAEPPGRRRTLVPETVTEHQAALLARLDARACSGPRWTWRVAGSRTSSSPMPG